MTLKRGIVHCDETVRTEAFYDEDDTWNGWLKPLLLEEDARRVLNECVENYYSDVKDFEFDALSDVFNVYDESIDNWVTFEGENIEFEGEIYHVYPIFAGIWIWDAE